LNYDQENLLDADVSEDPRRPRLDADQIDIRCDENGYVQKDERTLERRGVTQQTELWSKATHHKLSVVSKLLSISRFDLAIALQDCHTRTSYALCNGCRRVTSFMNRCERHYCPECQPRLSRDRRQSVEWWAKEIGEPKHVVLTIRNMPVLTKAAVKTFKACFVRLRRSAFARAWRGGFYRLEVTNESKGWHLHLHALIDCGWINQRHLADSWAKIVGQEIAIVHVRDVHSRQYLAEVTKYTVKGSQLAGWTPAEIAQFIDAFDGVRSFGVFGSLYGKRTEWREWLDSIQAGGHTCVCGCANFRILSENELEFENVARELRSRTLSTVPPPDTQSTFGCLLQATKDYTGAFRL
jgi:hypothetical protein